MSCPLENTTETTPADGMDSEVGSAPAAACLITGALAPETPREQKRLVRPYPAALTPWRRTEREWPAPARGRCAFCGGTLFDAPGEVDMNSGTTAVRGKTAAQEAGRRRRHHRAVAVLPKARSKECGPTVSGGEAWAPRRAKARRSVLPPPVKCAAARFWPVGRSLSTGSGPPAAQITRKCESGARPGGNLARYRRS